MHFLEEYSILEPFSRNPDSQIDRTETDNIFLSEHGRNEETIGDS